MPAIQINQYAQHPHWVQGYNDSPHRHWTGMSVDFRLPTLLASLGNLPKMPDSVPVLTWCLACPTRLRWHPYRVWPILAYQSVIENYIPTHDAQAPALAPNALPYSDSVWHTDRLFAHMALESRENSIAIFQVCHVKLGSVWRSQPRLGCIADEQNNLWQSWCWVNYAA